MWHLNFPPRDPASVSCIGRWILHHWTAKEVSSGLLLVLGFLRNLLGLCSNGFPGTARPKSFWYFSDLLLFPSVPLLKECRMGCFLMDWVWKMLLNLGQSCVCLLRAAFVVEAVVMSWYLGLPLPCCHQQGLFLALLCWPCWFLCPGCPDTGACVQFCRLYKWGLFVSTK